MTANRYTVLKFSGDATGTPESMYSVLEYVAQKSGEGRVAVVVAALGRTTEMLMEAIDRAESGDFRSADKTIDVLADNMCSVATRAFETMVEGTAQRAGVTRLSAMVGDLLDPLRRLLYGVSLLRQASPQTRDLVLSFGERISARLVVELLLARSLDAIFVDSREWTVTDASFSKALVDWAETEARVLAQEPEWRDRISVHPGFLGKTPDNRTTTLGRNGSDYTATLLARALQAVEVVVSTDVGGVMTADPALVAEAYPISRLTYMEALELANFGSRMYHPSTMIPLIASGIPMRIKHTTDGHGKGTIIDARGSDDDHQPTAITTLEHVAMIDVEWRALTRPANVAARVLDALADKEVTIWMATQAAHGQAVSVVIPESQLDIARSAIEHQLRLESLRGEVAPLDVRQGFTLLTLVAGAMGRTPNVAGRLFSSLGQIGVLIRAIAQGAGARSISCVIDGEETLRAVQHVHRAFNLSHH